MANLNIEQTENQARELLNSRIESVRALVRTRQRLADLQAELSDAERDDKRAYVRATKDGWSADELKKLGLEPAAAGRRRKTAVRNASGDTTPPSNSDRTETSNAQVPGEQG